MVDSIQILDAGWRATDSNDNVITDGILSFFDAGTSSPRTVYSDADLSASLGTSVNCNSGGSPITSGNAKCLIYTGDTPYKIRLTSVIFGGTVFEFDFVKGALNTDIFLTSAAAYDESVVTTSSNRSVGASDHGKFIDMNCTAGALTATIDDANTLGDGWFTTISHAGTANQIKITGDGTDTFALPGVSAVAFSLTGLGHTIRITCNGSNFKVTEQSPALLGNTTGMILIADRLSTPPGSPTAGARYIVGSGPTGAWSTFAQHDIAEATGQGTWIKYTPLSDGGWIAYVQDENRYYSFQASAWVLGMDPGASTSQFGLVQLADQAAMEASTGGRVVTADVQHFHTSAAKFWVYSIVSAGVPQLTKSYNVTSLTDTGTGQMTVVIANDYSDAFWPGNVTLEDAVSNRFGQGSTKAAGSWLVLSKDAGGSTADPTAWNVVGFGDL